MRGMLRTTLTLLALGVAPGAGSAAWASPDAEALSERAFEGAQWVLATQAARAVAQVGARAAAGDGPLAEKIRARQAAEEALAGLRRRLADAVAGGAVDIADLRLAAAGMAGRLERLDAEIRADFPRYAEMASPRPLNFEAVRRRLDGDEALVLFLSDRTATYVWAVGPETTVWHRSALSANALAGLVRRLRADLDSTGPARAAVALAQPAGPSLPGFDDAAAYRLYQELLAPVMPALRAARHVYVVKDGALSSLPLAVLLTAPAGDAMGADELRAAPWLIRRFAITTLPAVSSLSSLRRGAPAARSAGFVGFGDPVFSGGRAPAEVASRSIGAFFDGAGTRLDAIRALSPLPGTERELRRIARLFAEDRVSLTLGAAATEAAVKAADLSQATIISFATHGLITGDISGLAEPALAFTPPAEASAEDDGLLTASEASALKLVADWVILSACNTASSDGTPGAEGLSGLARAFLFAGARAILVSHWPVRDDVAATLTADTLRRLQGDGGLRRAEALRQAVLAVLQDASDPTLAHPSAWAPFVLVGDGGALGG